MSNNNTEFSEENFRQLIDECLKMRNEIDDLYKAVRNLRSVLIEAGIAYVRC